MELSSLCILLEDSTSLIYNFFDFCYKNLIEAAEYIEQISDVLGGISIDIFKVREKMCKKNRCNVIRGNKSIEHIFAELYTAPKEFIHGYFKVKVIELLMFLSSLKEKDYQKEQKYFDRNQVLTVKKIKNYMIEHIQEHISLEELSKMFNIPLTSMKNCFKGIYGISIYAYLKDYRINTAALLLRQTNESITQIANRIGYENPSEFSEAFKKIWECYPQNIENHCLNRGLFGFLE